MFGIQVGKAPMRVLLLSLLVSVIANLATADTMECSGGIIDSAEIDPPDQSEIRRRCGEPDELLNEGYRWVYSKTQGVYVLQFNINYELISIQRRHQE